MNLCVSCKHWNMRESASMARMGFGQCEVKQKGHYTSEQAAACSKFNALPDEQVKARRDWIDKQKG